MKVVFYKTIKQAMRATKKLGIKTPIEYKMLYKGDPLLHSSPSLYYKDSWNKNGKWVGFLKLSKATPKICIFHPTIQEAMISVDKLGIRSARDYLSRRSEDPLLPYSPEKIYAKNWSNVKKWNGFLGKVRINSSSIKSELTEEVAV